MKKLSKVLAFALAFAMTMSMGSFAATFVNSEFSDIDTATNPDAISQLAALDVMNGYTDGTIRPNGDITRAEIAKMIYVIKMGGKDDGAAYYKSVKTNLTDVEGHWAEGYIKYCYSTGVIAGRDDNKFYPDDNVTGIELAKMLLVVQGYNAQRSGLVGAGWSNNVVELGAENEYFKGYNTLLNSPATREGAASVIVNALDATIVTWSDDAGDYIEAETNKKTESIGKRYFGLTTYEGILLSTGEYFINLDIDGDGAITKSTDGTGDKIASAAKHKISMNVVRTDDGASVNTGKGEVQQFSFDEDATELLGQYVKLSVDKNGNVYGIYALADQNTVVDTTVDKVVAVFDSKGNFDNKIEIDGTSYKVDTAHTDVYTTGDGKLFAGGMSAYFKEDETFDGSSVRFIDNSGDGRFDIALVNPILAVREVTSTSSTSFSAGEKVNYDDIVYAEKFQKGDYVVKTTNFFEGKDEYSLAKVVEGEVTSVAVEKRKDASSTTRELQSVEIDDETWYTKYDSYRGNDIYGKSVNVNTGSSEITNSSVGGTQKLVTVGNVIYYSEAITSGASDIAFVTELGASQTTSVSKMKLLFSDGTTATVNCTKATKPGATVEAAVTAAGAITNPSDFTTKVMKEYVGHLVSYEINDDGDYELTLLNGNPADTQIVSDAGYSAAAEITEYQNDKNRVYDATTKSSYIIDNNATVFIQYKDDGKDKYTVISGEALLDFSSKFGDGTSTGYVLTSKSGVKAASVVLLIDTGSSMPGSELNKGLAVITSNATTQTKIGSTNYYRLTVWTEEGEQVLYVSALKYRDNGMKLGSSFVYNLDTDNKNYAIAKDITMLNGAASIYYIDGNKSVAISNTGTTQVVALSSDETTRMTTLQAAQTAVTTAQATYDGKVTDYNTAKAAADAAPTDTDKATAAETAKTAMETALTALNDAKAAFGDAQAAELAQLEERSRLAAGVAGGALTADEKKLYQEAVALKKTYDEMEAATAGSGDTYLTSWTSTVDGSTTYANISALNTAIAGYKDRDDAAGISRTYKISSDIKVLNVDTKATKISGVDDDSIYEASKIENSDDYMQNAYYLVDKDEEEVQYIVVDINGNWLLSSN